MGYPTWNKEQFIEAIKTSTTIAEAINKLGLNKKSAGNYTTIKKYITLFNIDITHFKISHLNKKIQKIPTEQILVENSYFSRTALKLRIIKEKLLPNLCAICKISHWHGKKLVLQLDHINGNRTDNRITNLRLLCPNCHSLTPTFSKGHIRKKSKENNCTNCKIKISNKAKLCLKCLGKTRLNTKTKIDWLDSEILLDMINKSNYVQVAKILGVSDNAIRKRLKKFPPKK